MALHEVQLKGYSVRPGNLSLGTFDSYGIEQLHVTADDSWDGLDILAVFHAPNGDAKKVVVGADGMLNVPPEATAKQAGNGRIVFVGLAENVQRITVDMGYNIKTHSDIEGDNPGVPTPDVVQQILGNSNHAVSIATAAQVSAENARLAAEDAAKKAGEEAGGAAYSAAAAKKSAEDAAASSKIAAGKAEASASSANVANESAKASQAAQSGAESTAQSAAKSARAAADSAASIVGSQEESAASADAAKNFAQQAKNASDSAAASASASKEAATQARESNTSAAGSAADAEAAKTAAAESSTAAAKSAADADRTANSIKDSMAQIAANKEAVSYLKEDKLDKPANPVVGQILRVKSISDTGEITLETVSCGLPDGGTAGQVLVKKSDDSFDTEWVNNFTFIKKEQPTQAELIEKYKKGPVFIYSNYTNKCYYTCAYTNNNLYAMSFLDAYANILYVNRLSVLPDNSFIETQFDVCTVPDGGTTGQILAKKSDTDGDTEWVDMPDVSQLEEDVTKLKEDTTAFQKRQNVLVGSETGNPASCNDAYSAPLCGLTVYGKSTQDGTPTPDAPVPIVSAGDGGSVAVKVTGKNLLNILDRSDTTRGVTVTAKNGLISISGTATDSGYAALEIPSFIISGVVILSSSTTYPNVKLVSKTWDTILTQNTADKMSDTATRLTFSVVKGQTYNLTGIKVQLELGSTATTYEPYREQLLTLLTPNGLPGIPVTSGGNYTDQNGQQWICDEVDLERGVKVQRIDKTAFDSTKTLAEQNAILATPIETQLTPAEIAAYKALTAYAPDTVVQASDGAGIKLDYQRDVNLVVKNLEDAIASMTTT